MNVKVWLMSLFVTLLISALSLAEESKRLEVAGSYDILKPKDPFGNWIAGSVTLYHKIEPTFTYFISGAFHDRKEGEAFLLTGGAYKDWTKNLYSYTALSGGTFSAYLPKYRIDHEFYYKLGEHKNWVPSIGISYIRYHDEHRDLIYVVGVTYYGRFWNLSYKHFINRSDPGGIYSSSDLISLGIGKEKDAWTYLTISFGKQAYLATYLASPEEISQRSLNLSLTHRKWLTRNFGLIGSIGYFKLEKGYEKYSFGAGFFKEF